MFQKYLSYPQCFAKAHYVTPEVAINSVAILNSFESIYWDWGKIICWIVTSVKVSCSRFGSISWSFLCQSTLRPSTPPSPIPNLLAHLSSLISQSLGNGTYSIKCNRTESQSFFGYGSSNFRTFPAIDSQNK